MATWESVVEYVTNNYLVGERSENMILMSFEVGGGRTQRVLLSPADLMGGTEEWLLIESVIGDVDEVDLRAAVAYVGDMVCGGLAMLTDTHLGIRHAVPLENLDINELERPLELVTTSTDELERLLLGRDRY